MDKNTIWAIILSTLVLVGFMFVQTTFYPSVAVEQLPTENTQSIVETEPTLVNVASTSIISDENSDSPLEEKQYTITTSKAKVTFTNKGGDIISYELIDHKDGDEGVQLADNITASNRAFSLAFGNNNNIINDYFNVKMIDDYTIGFFKKFSINNSSGTANEFTLVKQYTFNPDEYVFKLDILIEGYDGLNGLDFGGAAYTLRTSPQIGPHFDKKVDRYENRTFMSYSDGKQKKQTLSDGQSKVFDKGFTWTGVAGKYFTILVSPVNTSVITQALYSTALDLPSYANAQVMLTRSPIVQSSVQDTYYIYAGPRTEKTLEIYNNATENYWKLSNLRLDEGLSNTGFWSWLEATLKFIMEIFYKMIPNWGVSIILMTILLKVILFPLTKKSSMSTLKMQEVQPLMQELQTKYKNNPEKLNVEMAKLYKETGYNPLSGCLPLLIQFPLIFAMFNLFNNYFEFRGAMFIPGWIPDLSVGDSIYTLKSSIPFIGNQIRILPIIYVISQLLFGKFTNTSGGTGSQATQMKIMMYGMPLMFFFMFYSAPSGLLLYWTVSNLLQLVQQIIINKAMHANKMEIKSTKK